MWFDIKGIPIVEIRLEGILTSDGMLHELDIIALATGFDSATSAMKNMGLRNIYGEARGRWVRGPISA